VKGPLNTWMGDGAPERGGRAKRMVRVAPKGVLAAKHFYEAVTRASRGSWATHRNSLKNRIATNRSEHAPDSVARLWLLGGKGNVG